MVFVAVLIKKTMSLNGCYSGVVSVTILIKKAMSLSGCCLLLLLVFVVVGCCPETGQRKEVAANPTTVETTATHLPLKSGRANPEVDHDEEWCKPRACKQNKNGLRCESRHVKDQIWDETSCIRPEDRRKWDVHLNKLSRVLSIGRPTQSCPFVVLAPTSRA